MRSIIFVATLFVAFAGVAYAGECAATYQLDGAFCYPDCKAGFSGGGPVCYKSCEAGFVDSGLVCTKPEVSVGKTPKPRDAGSPLICDGNEEQNGALCYPPCRPGYRGVGPLCWQDCPTEYHDDGATCRRDAHIFSKASYPRPGRALHACPAGRQLEGALCFTPCASGYRGVGPLCWPDCGAGFHDDGTACHKDAIIIGKESYGRGAGQLKRSDLEGIITRYLQSSYNTLRSSAKPLTTAEKNYLKQWFPDRLVDKIYVTEESWPGPTPFFPPDVNAITLGRDFVAIRAGARTLANLKHELVHVCQYDKLGTSQFGHDYASQFVDAAYNYWQVAFERDAFAFEKIPSGGATSAIDTFTGSDGTRGNIYATCK